VNGHHQWLVDSSYWWRNLKENSEVKVSCFFVQETKKGDLQCIDYLIKSAWL